MATFAIIIAGLGFGDCGKGSIVDYLARRHQAELVVRYNGGAQAAHNVVDDQGRHHCFSQFGSGTLAGAKTFLSRYMLVNPIFMLPEAKHLESLGVVDPFKYVYVDRNALVTTPYHVSANRLREILRGDARHGSCGMGIGETVEHAMNHTDEVLRVGDLADARLTTEKLLAVRARLVSHFLKEFDSRRPDGRCRVYDATDTEALVFADDALVARLAATYKEWSHSVHVVDTSWLSDALRHSETVIFEGAQGVLLDENYGFHPHTTWSTCTFQNALSLLNEAGFRGRHQRLGVTRTYHTRHGAGPFPTERPGIVVLPGEHNGLGEWQGAFRVGHLDLPLLRYAAHACGIIDALAVTCADHTKDGAEVCTTYNASYEEHIRNNALHYMKPVTETCSAADILKHMSEATQAPITIISHGPTAADKQEI